MSDFENLSHSQSTDTDPEQSNLLPSDRTDGKLKQTPYIGPATESPAYQVDPGTFIEEGYRIRFDTY